LADPRALAFARLCVGISSYFGGRWQRAIDELREAEQIFRGLHGVAFQLDSCRTYRLWALAWQGWIRSSTERVVRGAGHGPEAHLARAVPALTPLCCLSPPALQPW